MELPTHESKKTLYPEVEAKLDMLRLEDEILSYWKNNNVFQERLKLNSTLSKNYSFIDGPITANNPMGLHHVWGRTLKDLIQRYWAMKGYQQRFQNGFDCQGLWIEVEVEKALGLNSKKAIEEFGLEKFSNKCKERLDTYSKLITSESQRLGQWMDWDHSYFTHTDTNISYIWHFLKTCHEKGWIIKGNFPMPWCVRCGTSLSQHEQHDSYKEMKHTAVYVKFPIKTTNESQKEFILVWTTTPWTLTANIAVAVHPTMTYCKVKQNDEYYYLAKSRMSVLIGDYQLVEKLQGKDLVGKILDSPFNYLTAQKDINHKVIGWFDVSGEEGTGFVHIAPGCGAEDYELSKSQNLKILSPIDEFGIFTSKYDEFSGLEVAKVTEKVKQRLAEKTLLYKSEKFTHRYPSCWRCHEELVFRLVEEWFIDCEEIRPLLKEATKRVEWCPNFYEKRMLDWLNNMGNWCISRKRYWGLPLPFFECLSCGELTVLGSKEELFEKAIDDLSDVKELHRPWIDTVRIKCPKCGNVVKKVTEVGDCWLDAGIVPFSTLKYLEDNAYWQKWFPAEAICEMREQIRLWFYSQLFMSVTLTGEAPYKKVIVHEKVHDKDGKPMHRSWGNAIWFSEAVKQMGADIIRWSFAKQPLTQVMNFGLNLESELKPFFLTIWNIYSFFATFANLDSFIPNEIKIEDLKNRSLLDKWLLSALQELIKEVRRNLDHTDFQKATSAIEQFVDKLSTWYIRRSRRRFWKSEKSEEKTSGYITLYEALITLVKLIAPFTPFFSEYLYQMLNGNIKKESPSVHLCDYPKVKNSLIDKNLNEKMNNLLEIVKLGRAARSSSNIRLRQPLSELLVWCKESTQQGILKEFKNELLAELNVKKVKVVQKPEKFLRFTVKPNYPILGPKLKSNIQLVENKLKELSHQEILIAYYQQDKELALNIESFKHPLKLKLYHDVLLDAQPIGSHAIAINTNFAVALNISLTEDLRMEGLARDLVRYIQEIRKKMDLQVDDKILVQYFVEGNFATTITTYQSYIITETLATKLVKLDSKPLNGEKIILNNEEVILNISTDLV
ncbi:MAG: isoleucine--tRNA ligase [Candidatus Heimdallarchaeota archaeon]|nr:isoleucine--tRNA ligase [Candidatus Heimdallarchaeota archaeon]